MFKILLVMTCCALSEGSYGSRISSLKMRSPVSFRPGVVLPRPAYQQRIVPTASRRAPFLVYRNIPHRYAMKHVNPAPTRNLFSPWKTTRLPIPGATPEYEFVRAASSPVIQADGAIHTIPAPNLSLSEKPIVVVDSSESSSSDASEAPKATYEVTEKYADQPIYHPSPKIEPPIGFSKASGMSAAELQTIMRNNAALHIAAQYGLPIHLTQPSPQTSMIPQQFSMPGFSGITSNQQDFKGTDGILLPPNAIYQDPFIHQFYQQFPSLDFVPFTPDFHTPAQTQSPGTETPLFLLQNEQIIKQQPSSFVAPENEKNIVERETQESAIASIVPQAFSVKNVSENIIEEDVKVDVTTSIPQNHSTEPVTAETQAPTTTAKHVVETNTDPATPVYYAQIGQSVGNVIANGFYTDVRAATESEKSESKVNTPKDNITTTTLPTTTQRETKALFTQNIDKKDKIDEFNNLIASPFEKTAESVNVAYTLLRANEKQPKVNQDGEIFAGQLVEAKISEDQDFNKEKAGLASRPPLRLFAVTEKRVSETTPQRSVVKAKIPPKSKLTFDAKTGEPVLRVYASYVDNPVQKEVVTQKLANMKRKDVTRKQENIDWKTDSIKSLEKEEAGDINHMAQFGLKIKSRSDDYMPIFYDYEE